MKILLLLTRRLDGRRSGRRVVLQTIDDSLTAAGHDVVAVCIDKTGTDQGQALRPPHLGRVVWNVLTKFVPSRRSLNECLYDSPRLVRQVRAIIKREGCQLIVADMARTAQLAERGGLPWIVDLDDLLSRRYDAMANSHADARMILGYFAEQLPTMMRSPAAWLARRLLRREAMLMRHREWYYAQAANGVCLVAADEAKTLAQRTGRDITWMPMSVAITDKPAAKVTHRPMSAVFMGGLDYQPNLEAVRGYIANVLPRLDGAGLGDLVLNVLGHCPDDLRSELESANVKLLGYVDSVQDELHKHQVFVSPIISGTGLKTKVLEAMGVGLPVVGTPEAFKGLNVTHHEQGYIADTPSAMIEMLQHIRDNPEQAQQVGLAGRALVEASFSPQVLAQRWGDWVKKVIQS